MGSSKNRIDRQTLDEYYKVFGDFFKSHGLDDLIKPPLFYSEKPDFGDVDFLIDSIEFEKRTTREEFFTNIEKHFGMVKKNNETLYKTNQVQYTYNGTDFDFLFSDNFDLDFKMLSYNDLGGFISDIAKHNSIYLSLNKGVFIELGEFRGKPFIDKVYFKVDLDFDTVLEILGMSPERWYSGFKSLDEIFDFVCSSPYFNHEYYRPKNLNNKRRQRAKKRNSFIKFNEYLDTHTFNKVHTPNIKHDMKRVGFDYSHVEQAIEDRIHYEENVAKNRAIRKKKTISLMNQYNLDGKTLGLIYENLGLNNDMEYDYLSERVSEWLKREQ